METVWVSRAASAQGSVHRMVGTSQGKADVVTTSVVSAKAGHQYILTNSEETTLVNLPSTSTLLPGDTISVGSTNRQFEIQAAEGDSILPGPLPINLGTVMQESFPWGDAISAVACSSDGEVIIAGYNTQGVWVSFNSGTTFAPSPVPVTQEDQAFDVEDFAAAEMDPAGSVVLLVLTHIKDVSSHILVGAIDREEATIDWVSVEEFDMGTAQWTSGAVSSDGNYMIIGSRDGTLFYSNNRGVAWSQIDTDGDHPWSDVSINNAGIAVAVSKDGAVQTFILDDEISPWPSVSLPDLESWTSCYIPDISHESGFLLLATYDSVYLYSMGNWLRMTPGVSGIHKVFLADASELLVVAGYSGIATNVFSGPFEGAWIIHDSNSICIDMQVYTVDDTYHYLSASSYIMASLRTGELTTDPLQARQAVISGKRNDRVTLIYVGNNQFYCSEVSGTPFLGEAIFLPP